MPGDDTGSHWGSCPHQGLVMLAKALIGYRHFTVVQFCFHKKKKKVQSTQKMLIVIYLWMHWALVLRRYRKTWWSQGHSILHRPQEAGHCSG